MSRLMLDTCIVFDMLTNFDGLDKYTIHLLEDPNCTLYTSFETMRELVVLFNKKFTFYRSQGLDLIEC